MCVVGGGDQDGAMGEKDKKKKSDSLLLLVSINKNHKHKVWTFLSYNLSGP